MSILEYSVNVPRGTSLTVELNEKLKKAIDILSQTEGENLISILLYGSKARKEEKEKSDTDLFIVLENIENFLEKRKKIYKLLNKTFKSTEFSPLIIDKNSASKLQPIHFELAADGIVLFDKDNFMQNILNKVKKLIKEIGAKRYKTKDGCYGWILKENLKRGEIIELNI